MASSGKRKTTMAKMNRERKLLERRQEKQAKKVARRASAADPGLPSETVASNDDGQVSRPGSAPDWIRTGSRQGPPIG